ncbi:MAG: hypothetical protein ABI353_02045 [Isosphaeraceae bacterium]
MFNAADIRFKAAGRQTAQALYVHFPLCLRVHRPAAVQALADARRVINQLREAAEEADFPNARLSVLDLDAGTGASELTIEQKSQREVRLQVLLTVSLSLQGDDIFWVQAAAIAAASDFLQNFSLRPHDKGIEIDVQQARPLTKEAAPSEVKAGAVV